MVVNRAELMKSMTAHFRARLAEDVVVVEVPEWSTPGDDGEPVPLKIHSRPMNLEQRDRVYRLMSEGSILLSFAEALLVMARDEEGNRIWADVERDMLIREVDPDVLMRVVREMRSGKPLVDKPEEAIEEASGN